MKETIVNDDKQKQHLNVLAELDLKLLLDFNKNLSETFKTLNFATSELFRLTGKVLRQNVTLRQELYLEHEDSDDIEF